VARKPRSSVAASPVTIRLSPDERAKLDRLADARRESASTVLRTLLAAAPEPREEDIVREANERLLERRRLVATEAPGPFVEEAEATQAVLSAVHAAETASGRVFAATVTGAPRRLQIEDFSRSFPQRPKS
jgi:predicted transcriptional regulator